MPDYFYARGRILESIQYISDELKEFEGDYDGKTWQEYQKDRKTQKLMDRTVENILTALIEVSGTLATRKAIKVESYSDALRKAADLLGFNVEDQEKLGKLAAQRNRLAHRYLNFRWQVIRIFKETKPLLLDFIKKILELEKSLEKEAAQ
jgi:uncharacterized protein YutE (UPF0331/DUF86 family)